MGRPEKQLPTNLEEAFAELRRNPANTVHVRIDGLDIELRAVPPSSNRNDEPRLGDWMAAAGPWQGETEEEILDLLRQARRSSDAAPPPEMP